MSSLQIEPLSKVIIEDLKTLGFSDFVEFLNKQVDEKLSVDSHGDFSRWSDALISAPPIESVQLDVSTNAVTIKGQVDDQQFLKLQLKKLIPWRKGPYQIADTFVDTEWRSDFKWDRLKHAIDLNGKRVLDVGCGNGYHCWRMLQQQPKWVFGIDPNVLFNLQFRFVNHYAKRDDIEVVPIGIEDLPKNMAVFDTVFSMGVLYHRKSPFDHLQELRSLLVKGGELILETLVIEGDENSVLVPLGRYAKMRNVWFIPSVDALKVWLKKAGFKQPKVIDVSQTTIQEQRATEWMLFESLVDYLDENDHNLTVEGHPAPRRVVISATI